MKPTGSVESVLELQKVALLLSGPAVDTVDIDYHQTIKDSSKAAVPFGRG